MTNDSRPGGHDASRAARVAIRRCQNSHAFFFPHDACPFCRARTFAVDVSAMARLVSRTIVRVSPTGTPFGLGLARLSCGAQTLCIVEGGIEEADGTEVVIIRRGDLYYATPAKGR